MIGGACVAFLMAGGWIIVAARMAADHRGLSSMVASWLAVIFAVIGILAVAAGQPQP